MRVHERWKTSDALAIKTAMKSMHVGSHVCTKHVFYCRAIATKT